MVNANKNGYKIANRSPLLNTAQTTSIAEQMHIHGMLSWAIMLSDMDH